MASQEAKKSKKRKSMGSSSADVSVVVAESSSGAGPAFVNFPSIKPSKRTPFTLYSRDPASSSELAKQHTLVAGETEDVEYFSTNRDRNAGEGADCQYLAAVYDPATRTLNVSPAPLYLLSHRVKRLREAPLSGTPEAMTMWKAKRNDLGETFGTRKAKSQIRAEERNKVDISAMSGVRTDLIASIGGVEAKPEGPVAPSEFIPVPNTQTNVPTEVYPRSAIVPDAEWSSIQVAAFTQAEDDRARSALLPFRRSRWIEDKLRVTVEGPSGTRKNNLRMLYYLSCLLGFYNAAHGLQKMSVSEMPAKFPGIPAQVLNGLCARFAEPVGKRFAVTDKCKMKLLAWICVCYLAADGWSVDVAKVAKELALPPTKVTDIFKSLGCSVDIASPAEREKLGLTQAEASKQRRAVLKAPVKFPKTKTRGPARH